MMTSGLRSAIHFLEKSKPLNTGAQYGVSVLPVSHAAPIAGTCETFTLAMILATLFRLRLFGPLRLATVALDRPTALQHHLGILLLGEPGHACRHELEREPVGREQLGEEIDIAAELDHATPVALENGLALLLGHRPLFEVSRLVLLELLAIRGLHQRHAEHVDVIALARALRIEQSGAGNVVEALGRLDPIRWFGLSHDSRFQMLGAPLPRRRTGTGDGGCQPGFYAAETDPGPSMETSPPGRRRWACAWRCSDVASPCPTGSGPEWLR